MWLKNTNAITSTQSGGVSLQNDGKTELVQDVSILGKLGVSKTPNASYSADISGNVNFSGDLYKNGVVVPGLGVVYITNDTTLNNYFGIGAGVNGVGAQNMAFGTRALTGLTTGVYNVALGYETLLSCNTGIENFAIGANTLKFGTSFSYNVGIGNEVMANNNGISNICIGKGSGGSLTFANENIHIGYFCCIPSTGSSTTAIGSYCGQDLTTAGGSTFIGYFAGSGVITGGLNTCIGYGSGMTGGGGAFVNSTAIGVGAQITASNSVFLGTLAQPTICVGGLTLPASTTFTILGNFSANSLTITPAQIAILNAVASGNLPSTRITNTSFVNLTTAQTISGIKTFNSPPVMSGASITLASIPLSAINANLGNVVSDNVNATITAVYTFSTNPVFNAGGIAVASISGTAVNLSSAQTISGIKTFTANPVFNSGAIPVASIAGTAVNLSSTQTITGAKTFSTAPVMSGANITSNSIPIGSIVNGGNLVRNDTNATITGTYTFSTNPIFSTNSINPNYITYMISQNTIQQYAFGEFCLFQKTVGATQNNAFGQEVMSATGSVSGQFQGSSNCGFGTYSMYQSETAYGNSCFGNNSGFMLQQVHNSAFGHSSMFNSDGSYNTICGFNSGTNPFVTGPISLTSCSALGSNTYFDGNENHITLIGADSERDPAAHPANNAIILGRFATDDTYVGKDLYVYNTIRTNTIDAYSGTTITISNKLINNNLETNTINGTNAVTLNIGNTNTTTHLNGSTTISNAQKINGYSTLSGTPNTLTKPLSTYYQLTTTSNGALTLPVIDATMYGSEIVFTKVSTDAIWTINAGTGNTFRLYKSNSTATATSISLSYNNTSVRIVATQTSVWEVIDQDSMFDAVNQFIIGRQYFPFKINPTNITVALTNWNVLFPSAFYGIQLISITTNATLTLPLTTDNRVPPNMRIKFRRVGGTTTTTFGIIASGTDTILPLNSATAVSSTTPLASGVYQFELILNGSVWIVFP